MVAKGVASRRCPRKGPPDGVRTVKEQLVVVNGRGNQLLRQNRIAPAADQLTLPKFAYD